MTVLQGQLHAFAVQGARNLRADAVRRARDERDSACKAAGVGLRHGRIRNGGDAGIVVQTLSGSARFPFR